MMRRTFVAAAALSLSMLAGAVAVQAAPAELIPGGGLASPLPTATHQPDPKRNYKVVFDVGKAAPKTGDVNPALKTVAEFTNTLAADGVKADHRHIAVVLHQAGTEAILNDETFRAKFGRDNPDLPLIRAMSKAGVKFYVCGQAVVAHKIDPKTIVPEVELTLWAITTMIDLEQDGYIHMGG